MIAAGNIGCMMQIGVGHQAAGRAHGGTAGLGDGRAAAGGARVRGLIGVLRLLVILGLLAGAAAAQERRMLDADEAAAFRGVGRLNIAGARFCTATLISPVVVVTAAHCLYHPRTGARVADDELRFVAGYRVREWAAVRRVTATAVDPAYAFEARATYAGVGADLAIGRLDRPVPESVLPFATGDIADGPPLSIVSYAQDRPHAPSIETPCAHRRADRRPRLRARLRGQLRRLRARRSSRARAGSSASSGWCRRWAG